MQNLFLFTTAVSLVLVLCSITCTAMEVERRAPFNAWAGKRSLPRNPENLAQALRDLNDLLGYSGRDFNRKHDLLEELSNEISYPEQKRGTPFNAWAGKRKRTPFNSWAGKRSSSEMYGDDDNVAQLGSSRRFKRASGEIAGESDSKKKFTRQIAVPFSAWGGKRTGARFARNVDFATLKVMRPARAVFSAWGGKK